MKKYLFYIKDDKIHDTEKRWCICEILNIISPNKYMENINEYKTRIMVGGNFHHFIGAIYYFKIDEEHIHVYDTIEEILQNHFDIILETPKMDGSVPDEYYKICDPNKKRYERETVVE